MHILYALQVGTHIMIIKILNLTSFKKHFVVQGSCSLDFGCGKSGKMRLIQCGYGFATLSFSVLLLYTYFAMFQVVKYWKAKGQSGFYVWRYLLRRDDPEPAPWHKVT
jgi:hypothetical protein